MAIARPRFILSATGSTGFIYPMALIAGMRLSHATPQTRRTGLRSRPLLHQARSYVEDATPGTNHRVTLQASLTTAYMASVNQTVDFLWDTIGTAKLHLWIIDDDQQETLVTSNNEAAGANVVVEYAGTPKKTWLGTNNYLFMPDNGVGSGDEVVVVEATADTPSSFTADLIYLHDSGSACYRVSMVYPDAVLEAIRPTPAPLGNSTLTLDFLSGEAALFGTSLPT